MQDKKKKKKGRTYPNFDIKIKTIEKFIAKSTVQNY